MNEVIKPPSDKSSYRHFRLESGLSVLLISDPDIHTPAIQSSEGGSAGQVAAAGLT